MTLVHILIFSAFSLLVRVFLPQRLKLVSLLSGSVLALFWLQPAVPVRNMDFWFPVITLGLVLLTWLSVRSKQGGSISRAGIGIIAGLILLVAATRYAGPLCCLTPTRPPPIGEVIIGLAIIGLMAGLIGVGRVRAPGILLTITITILIVLFIIQKYPPTAQAAAAGLRMWRGQDPALASPIDLRWLGFSYLAFRLMHVLRDAQARRLPEFNAAEFATYVLFYPALTAGPIDRLQRFVKDLRDPQNGVREDMIAGGQRIALGVLKKFALADTLALFALNAQNAAQISSPLWSWVLLYAYSLRIFFDFAGYTDIAIGIGRIAGVQLPENFQAPYLKTNLTAFWNSWHITLAKWFRAYFFNPLTRTLRASPSRPPVWVVILTGQVSTMLLIGLWHGITWNFTIWGLWHGLGLFAHNRWSDFVRSRWGNISEQHPQRRLLTLGGWFLTFQFVTLGWVWFALPNPELAVSVYARLLGI